MANRTREVTGAAGPGGCTPPLSGRALLQLLLQTSMANRQRRSQFSVSSQFLALKKRTGSLMQNDLDTLHKADISFVSA